MKLTSDQLSELQSRMESDIAIHRSKDDIEKQIDDISNQIAELSKQRRNLQMSMGNEDFTVSNAAEYVVDLLRQEVGDKTD